MAAPDDPVPRAIAPLLHTGRVIRRLSPRTHHQRPARACEVFTPMQMRPSVPVKVRPSRPRARADGKAPPGCSIKRMLRRRVSLSRKLRSIGHPRSEREREREIYGERDETSPFGQMTQQSSRAQHATNLLALCEAVPLDSCTCCETQCGSSLPRGPITSIPSARHGRAGFYALKGVSTPLQNVERWR